MRPKIEENLNPEEFIKYYWLKEELLCFCRICKLSRLGSKAELFHRIYEYLKTKKILAAQMKKRSKIKIRNPKISLNAKIPEDYRNDEIHRAFFKAELGKLFKFNVQFMNWMKSNSGKTYQDAILEYNRLAQEKKLGTKSVISSQFQYNQYIRDFFGANPGANLEAAIKCWKYKKSLPGQNKYQINDLIAIKK